MGRTPETIEVEVNYNGKPETISVDLFGWEKLDYVEKVQAAFFLEGAAVTESI